MSYIPITVSRRDRKKKIAVLSTKTVVLVTSLIGCFAILLLLPVYASTLAEYKETLLPLGTLVVFGTVLAAISVQLCVTIARFLLQDKSAQAAAEKRRRWLQVLLQTGCCGIVLYLLQPFICALIGWQGYKLMYGKSFTVKMVEEVTMMIEYGVSYALIIGVVLFAWVRWQAARPSETHKTEKAA